MGSAVKKSALLLAAACAFAVFPAGAAASTDAILQDCNDDGALSGHYSKGELQHALNNIPSDLAQYSDCESVIKQALLNQLTKKAKKHSGGGDSGGPQALISKAQRKAIDDKVKADSSLSDDGALPAPAGTQIKHAAGQTLASTATPSVPTALIVAIIGLFMLFAVELAGRVRKRRGGS